MANLLPFTGTSHDKDVASLVLDRARYSLDAYGDYYKTLIRYHRYYLSANDKPSRPEPPDIDNSGREWRADIFVPYSFATIEAALPRLLFALFGQRPYVQLIGRDVSDHQKAKIATSLLDFDMEQAQVDYKALLALKSFLKFGLMIGRVGWKTEFLEESYVGTDTSPQWDMQGNVIGYNSRTINTSRLVKKFDGPTFDPVSVFNFFPDPLYYEIDDMRYCAELQLTSLSEMWRENEAYKARTGKPLYKGLERLEGMGTGQALYRAGTWLGDSREETAEVFGFGHGHHNRFDSKTSSNEDGDEIWLLHYWEPDRHVVLANGIEVIRDADNPFDEQEVPYFSANCFPIEFEFYGMGMLHPVEGIQEELNAWRSIALDQGKINMIKPIAYDAESGLTELDFDIFPGSATPVRFEGGKPLAQPLYPRDTLPPETQYLEGMMLRDWQNALGTNDYMMGGGSGDAGTASEAAMVSASSSSRFKLQAFIGQKKFVEKLARKMFARRQQFLEEPEVFRVLGRAGYDFPQVSPDDIQGLFDYQVQGNVIGPNKEVELQQMIQFVTTASANPIMAQRLNWDALLEELIEKFEIRFPERFIMPPNSYQLEEEQLLKLLQMAIDSQDKNLAESISNELQMRRQMEQGPGGQKGGLGPSQMTQGVAGTQGAGQIAASPTDTMPTMGNMQGQAFGGSGATYGA